MLVNEIGILSPDVVSLSLDEKLITKFPIKCGCNVLKAKKNSTKLVCTYLNSYLLLTVFYRIEIVTMVNKKPKKNTRFA